MVLAQTRNKTRLVCIFLLCFAMPENQCKAAPDQWTTWLSGQPLTRLDWLIMNATRFLDKDFIHPEDTATTSIPSKYSLYSQFNSIIDASHMKSIRSFATYDFDQNNVYFTIVTEKLDPHQADCATLLRAFRDSLLTSFARDPVDGLTTDEDRAKYASFLLSEMSISPSRVGSVTEPKDLSEHLASITRIRAIVNKAGSVNFSEDITCEGRLTGREIMIQLR